MIILHITDIVNCNGNGVAVAVSNYVKQLNKLKDVIIYNLNDEVFSDGIVNYSYNNYKSINELPKPYNNPNIVIFNEVYKIKYIKLYKECIKRKIPYIIIPHGCLMKESQNHKILKKKIGNLLLFDKFIKNAEAIQFLNENEKNKSKFKYKKSIISGNGIENPHYKNEYNENKDIVFIGRYSVKIKGLDLLIKVCKKYKKWFEDNNIQVKLYGLSEKKDIIYLNKLIIKSKVNDIIKINNAVFGKEKEKILKGAYVFIQLSRHEGQPMGIIEPLSIGLPCIVTYGTSLGNYVNENKCGISVNFNVEDVFKAIKTIYNDEKTRNVYSKNAFKVSNKTFNWNQIIKKLLKEYEEIIK